MGKASMNRISTQPSEPHHRSETWDATATDYEAFAEPFTRQYAQAALNLAGGVRPGERVLDVAAGTGALTLLAARAGGRVLATDFSPGMVARIHARLSAEGLAASGCEARVLDGQALDLPDASFDAAFSIFGVMLFPDWARGLSELARVVRPEGRGVIAVWSSPEGAGPTPAFLDAYRRVFPERGLPPLPAGMLRLQNADALREEMDRAGFKNVAVHTITGAWEAPSADWVADNADRLFRWSALHAALREVERASLRDALRERLRELGGKGELRIASDAHVAVGRT